MALKPFSIAAGALYDSNADGKNYYSGKVVTVYGSDTELASLYSDSEGLTPIPQDGTSNVTNAQGEFSFWICLLYTSPSPRDRTRSRMPSSA